MSRTDIEQYFSRICLIRWQLGFEALEKIIVSLAKVRNGISTPNLPTETPINFSFSWLDVACSLTNNSTHKIKRYGDKDLLVWYLEKEKPYHLGFHSLGTEKRNWWNAGLNPITSFLAKSEKEFSFKPIICFSHIKVNHKPTFFTRFFS